MPPELDLTDPLRVLRVDQVARLLSIHPITVWKWSKQGACRSRSSSAA